MITLAGKTAIVTGAGRGIGRAHALALARHGASVVVNDLGVSTAGDSTAETPAKSVVSEIEALGGRAAESAHDISDWDQAAALIKMAVERFGRLDILVNNAGILRDRAFANMTFEDWDRVLRVHLTGHAAPARHAFSHWRDIAKATGQAVNASIINTTSIAGLFPNFGQANYVVAKAGIRALTQTLALEGARYGIRANAISPSAVTRLTAQAAPARPSAEGAYDRFAPENISPMVVWLADSDCQANGQIYQICGETIGVFGGGEFRSKHRSPGGWTPEAIAETFRGESLPLVSAFDALSELTGERV